MTPPSARLDAALEACAVMGVFRGADPKRAVELANSAWDQGIELVEVPVETLDAMPSLAAVAEAARDRGKIVGAGTILDPEQARAAVTLGAGFLVSPATDLAVHRAAADLGVLLIPGIATATEFLTARSRGATWIKAFPATVLGVQWFAAMLGPFPDARLVATGGVNPDNAGAFLDAGACVVGIGSALADPRHAETVAALVGRPVNRPARETTKIGLATVKTPAEREVYDPLRPAHDPQHTSDVALVVAERRVYRTASGKWTWKLISDRRLIAVDGTDGYDTEDDARTVADDITSGKFAAASRAIDR